MFYDPVMKSWHVPSDTLVNSEQYARRNNNEKREDVTRRICFNPMKVIVALKATWKLFYYKSNWRYGLECMSNLLRYMTRFLYSSIEMMFLVSDQIFYFLITPLKVLCAIDVAVKSKVTIENVVKVQKLWLPPFLNSHYIFVRIFLKQHLLDLKCYRRKVGAFFWYDRVNILLRIFISRKIIFSSQLWLGMYAKMYVKPFNMFKLIYLAAD